MTSDVISVHPEDNMRTIREGMRAFGLRHIPVVDGEEQLVRGKFGCLPVTTNDGVLVGIVTEHDLLKVLAAER